MEAVFESKKLELVYSPVGENKARKQSLGNIQENASTDSIGNFAKLMGQLAPTEEDLNTVMLVEKQRINIK